MQVESLKRYGAGLNGGTKLELTGAAPSVSREDLYTLQLAHERKAESRESGKKLIKGELEGFWNQFVQNNSLDVVNATLLVMRALSEMTYEEAQPVYGDGGQLIRGENGTPIYIKGLLKPPEVSLREALIDLAFSNLLRGQENTVVCSVSFLHPRGEEFRKEWNLRNSSESNPSSQTEAA